MSSPTQRETAAERRERRLAAREQRMQAAAVGRKRSQRRRRLQWSAVIIAVAALLALGALLLAQAVSQPAIGLAVADEGRDHVAPGTPIDYQNNPPASGPHYPVWTRSGVYSEAQPPGGWVHSLEHGYVVILYDCEACPELEAELREFYEAAPKSARYGYQKLIITPYPELESRIALVAWNRVLEMDSFDPEQALAFYRAYLDKGPEDAG